MKEKKIKFIYEREALKSLLIKNEELNLLKINISSRALENEEAIGNPDRDDFLLLRGKEVLLQTEVGGSLGQAFTSNSIAYNRSIKELLDLSDERPGNYALLVATLNALSCNYGVKVMDGLTDTKKLINFSDILLITGSILSNGTYKNILNQIGDKQFYFFGTTCAGLASINNIDCLCPLSK